MVVCLVPGTTKALDKVLRLRETSEAKELREIWGKGLWRGGNTALEGYGQPIRMSMENVKAQGDVIQRTIVKCARRCRNGQ
jgi:hypothetical protein